MIRLYASATVRKVLGRDYDTLSSGVGLPADAQCWSCGCVINLFASDETVELSAVEVTPLLHITVFAHRGHGSSQVMTPEQFQEQASTKPSPVIADDTVYVDPDGSILLENMLVDGRPVRIIPPQDT